MSVFKLPTPDDNDLIPHVGGDAIPKQIIDQELYDAAWLEGETYRLTSFEDAIGIFDGLEDERSTLARALSQNFPEMFVNEETSFYNSRNEKKGVSFEELTAEKANEMYGIKDRLSFNEPIKEAEAQLIYQRKMEEIHYQTLFQNASLRQKTGAFFRTMGSAFWDPLNIAVMFIPYVGTVPGAMAMGVKAGKVGVDAWRFYSTARNVLLFSAGFEVPIYMQKQAEQADYTLLDSALNVGVSGIIGGGLHVFGGRVADWVQGVDRDAHQAAFKVAIMQAENDKTINVSAILRASREISKKKNLPDGRLRFDSEYLEEAIGAQYDLFMNSKMNPKLKQVSSDDADVDKKIKPFINVEKTTGEQTSAPKKTLGELSEETLDLERVPDIPLSSSTAKAFQYLEGAAEKSIAFYFAKHKKSMKEVVSIFRELQEKGYIERIPEDQRTGTIFKDEFIIVPKKERQEFMKSKMQVMEQIYKKIDSNIKLTKKELDAITRWDDFNFNMQRYLGGKYKKGKGKQSTAEIRENIDAIRAAIEKSPLPQNIILYSGKNLGHFTDLSGPYREILPNDKKSAKWLIGKTIYTSGFLNGSLNRSTAERFAKRTPSATSSKPNKTPVIFKIFVPRGTKAIPGNRKEGEFILDAGTKLIIRKARWIGKGETRRLEIDAEVVAKSKLPSQRNIDIVNQSKQYLNDTTSYHTKNVELTGEERALNKREKSQKIDTDKDKKEVNTFVKEVDELEQDIRNLGDENLNKKLDEVNEKFNQANEKVVVKSKAAKAVMNCIIGKTDG